MELKKLGDIFKITSGGTPSKKKEEYYLDGDIPWIKTGDLKSKNIYKSSQYITELGVKNSSAKLFPKDTVLIAMYGATIGATSILKIEAATNQACAAFLPTEDVMPEYLYYFFKYNKEKIISKGIGGAQPNISATILKDFKIPLLCLDEQEKIVNILNKAQNTTNKRKEQINLLDELVKSRFIEMFGDPIRNIKCWQTKRMDEVAPVINYKGNFKQNEIWLLNLDMVESNTGKIIAYNYVTASEVGSSTCTFDTTNVLYSKLRPYLNKVVIPKEIGYATSEMMPLQPVKGILDRYYLAYMLRNKVFVDYISEKVSGAKMPRVTMNDFRDFKVPIPPIELQNQFANFVIEVDKLKFEMEKSLKELEDNFNSLMQRAFKGELF